MKQAHNLQDVLESTGLSLPELCAVLNDGIYDSALFKLSGEDHKVYHELFIDFEQSRNGTAENKGAALEKIASFILSKLGIYQVLRNRKTSTNEMDVILVRKLTIPVIGGDIFPSHIICECKNYGDSVSITYVGKFYALLKVSGINLGLMISNSKISGRSKWNDGCGFCRKIALKDNTYIINISYEDLKLIDEKNASIIQLINDKVNAIKLDVDISYDEHELCSDITFTSISDN